MSIPKKDSSGAADKTFGRRQVYNAVDMILLEPNHAASTASICALDSGAARSVIACTPHVTVRKTQLEVRVR